MAMTSRSKGKRKKGSKLVCPSCQLRDVSLTDSDEKGGRKAACLSCGHIFDFAERSPDSEEKGFGHAPASGSSGETWLIRLLMAVLVVAAIALAVGFRMGISHNDEDQNKRPSPSTAQTAEENTRKVPADIQEEITRAENSVTAEDRAIRKALGKFLGASSWASRIETVRHPEVTGRRMSEYYQNREDGPFENIVISTRVTRVGSLIVFTLEGENLPNKRLIVEEQHGKYLVDWEAFVLWQELPWSEIPAASADHSYEIRCLARPLPNNHPAYRSEDGWLSFELIHPGTQETLYGFLETHADLGPKNPRHVLQKGAIGPVTLAVTPMPGNTGQVVISEVLALGWVHPLPENHRNDQK